MMQPNEKGTQKDLVLYRIETSKSDIKAAEILLAAKEFRGANNRAYYGIYHAISAVHALDGNAYKRHKDALANFNNFLSKLSRKNLRFYIILIEIRQSIFMSFIRITIQRMHS